MDVEGRRDFWIAMRGFAARGKTVLFATHYLEEADANADRVILMARGTVVADGPTTEIKARVGRKTIRATLPDVEVPELGGARPGWRRPSATATRSCSCCSDSDRRHSGAAAPGTRHARDIEITGAASRRRSWS